MFPQTPANTSSTEYSILIKFQISQIRCWEWEYRLGRNSITNYLMPGFSFMRGVGEEIGPTARPNAEWVA